jgi:hypothetical protein
MRARFDPSHPPRAVRRTRSLSRSRHRHARLRYRWIVEKAGTPRSRHSIPRGASSCQRGRTPTSRHSASRKPGQRRSINSLQSRSLDVMAADRRYNGIG